MTERSLIEIAQDFIGEDPGSKINQAKKTGLPEYRALADKLGSTNTGEKAQGAAMSDAQISIEDITTSLQDLNR